MRVTSFLRVGVLSAIAAQATVLLGTGTAHAQVSDSQRAAARDLFKEGDTLQRAGKFAEALDKYQRAEAVFDAPTNMLRIAECEAALGRLVESAEAFRAVLRAPLPPGSPPAFQAAVDQARGELAQVEPRIPKLVVEVTQPPKPAGLQMQIDGQAVPAALVGAPMPLDPGNHKVVVSASGYASAEQQVSLREQESKTLSFALKAGPPSLPPGPEAPATGPAPSGSPAAGQGPVPPPPPVVEATATPAPPLQGARASVLLGAHLGWEFPAGKIPIDPVTSVDPKELGGSGPAIALDGMVRFARQWILGVVLEHAGLGGGSPGDDLKMAKNLGSLTGTSSSTTLLGLVGAFVANPDRPSFYGELGLGARWYSVDFQGAGVTSPGTYTAGELTLGAGIWVPAGRLLRLLPKANFGVGTFNPPSDSGGSGSPPGHVFIMVGLAGFINIDVQR